MEGGTRAVLLLHSFYRVTESNKLGVKLLVLSAVKGREEVRQLWRRGWEGSSENFEITKRDLGVS